MPFERMEEVVPLKMPQFQLREGQMFFLLAEKAHAYLDEKDQQLWHQIDGSKSLEALCAIVADAPERVQRFLKLGICEIAPAIFAANRRKVLVLEPHMDDAVLSIGGIMWKRRNECEFTVATIAKYSNFTSYYYRQKEFFNVAAITELRLAESRLAMRMLGGTHITLEECEAPLRYQPGNWTEEWYHKHQKSVAAFTLHFASESDISSWATSIERLLEASDAEEIWLPLGVGYHQDHELARNAWLRALAHSPTIHSSKNFYFYEDVPYAARLPEHASRILRAISSAGGTFTKRAESIATSLDGKLRLAAVFGSQFKPSYMAPAIQDAAKIAAHPETDYSEVFYQLDAAPGFVDELAASSGGEIIKELSERLKSWRGRHKSTGRIRILSPIAFGNWRDDIRVLLDTFPNAKVDVYISDNCIEETSRYTSPRLTVISVGANKYSWLWLLTRLFFSWPHALIFLSGEREAKKILPLVRSLLFLSDPLITFRMNHLAHACQRLSK